MSADTSAGGVAAVVAEWRSLVVDWARYREGCSPEGDALELACDLITALASDLAEYRQSADLRWRADLRAIAAWQAAGEGRELTWPGHADLCVWLLGERDQLAALYEDADLRRQVLANALAAATDHDNRAVTP